MPYYKPYNINNGTWGTWIDIGGTIEEIVGYNVIDNNLYVDARVGSVSSTTIYTKIINLITNATIQDWTLVTEDGDVIDADKWDGYQFSDYINQAIKTSSAVSFNSITSTDNLTILGDGKRIIFDSGSGLGAMTFPLIFPYTFSSSDYVSMYASGSSLVVDGDLVCADVIHGVGAAFFNGNLYVGPYGSNYVWSTNTFGQVYWGNTVNAWEFYLAREGAGTLKLYSADLHLSGDLIVDGTMTASTPVGSITTALAFAYAGTLNTTGSTMAPTIITPCSLDAVSATAFVKTACGSGSIIVDIHMNGTTIFGTQTNRPIIPSGSKYDLSGSPSVTSFPEGSTITMDIDSVGNSVGTDLSVILKCRQRIVFS